ncbi:MAG: LuxR C-terminal-related transcriptional regulator [Gammaproteobacteria bacterium]|nr:LuxR C-terminal-related transcriptional regulator [Gammaproteobacteria bacterium]
MDFDSLLGNLENTNCVEQLRSCCNIFVDIHNYDYYSLYGSIYTSLLSPSLHKISGPHNKRPKNNETEHDILQTCIDSTTPVILGNFSDSKLIFNPLIRTIHKPNARKLDIYFPIHFPVGKIAIFHLTKRSKKENIEESVFNILPKGRQFASEAGLAFVSLIEKEWENIYPELSQRERHCLLLTADGLSPKNIAEEIGLSQHTVIFYLKNVRKKYDAKNIQSAISKAILKGDIMPQMVSVET